MRRKRSSHGGKTVHSLAGQAAVEVRWHVGRLQEAAGQEQQPRRTYDRHGDSCQCRAARMPQDRLSPNEHPLTGALRVCTHIESPTPVHHPSNFQCPISSGVGRAVKQPLQGQMSIQYKLQHCCVP